MFVKKKKKNYGKIKKKKNRRSWQPDFTFSRPLADSSYTLTSSRVTFSNESDSD